MFYRLTTLSCLFFSFVNSQSWIMFDQQAKGLKYEKKADKKLSGCGFPFLGYDYGYAANYKLNNLNSKRPKDPRFKIEVALSFLYFANLIYVSAIEYDGGACDVDRRLRRYVRGVAFFSSSVVMSYHLGFLQRLHAKGTRYNSKKAGELDEKKGDNDVFT
ncbi:hypothetical protein L1987_64254 [Smallanthus sonchifolius]|uniref:Uncharacterized protein n=1 Tax=Smallanthus sonchifolius TaxID=185202 RepID=A0ACB9CFJ6_9ASTR|nr:hypothetical protein L1987_64254 [Smallanthus sonchifolius]